MALPLRRYLRLLGAYLAPHRGRAIGLAALLGSAIALQVANPQILRFFIDTALAGGDLEKLSIAAAAFIGIALLDQLLTIAATAVAQELGWRATNALRVDLTSHLLRLDFSFHERRRPGELIERIDGDVNALFEFFSTMVIQVIGSLALIGGVLAMLTLEDWRVGAAMTGFVAVALASLVRLRAFAIPWWRREREENARFFALSGELLTSREDLRGVGAVPNGMRAFFLQLRGWYPIARNAVLLHGSMWATSLTLFALGHATAFGVAGTLWRQGALSLGAVYLVFHYAELLRRPIEQIRLQLEQLQGAEACIDRIGELLVLESAIADGTGPPLPAAPLSVRLEDVDFRYGSDPPVLTGLRVSLDAGRRLGVVGRTGSGKTTLARLLVRQLDARSGRVRVGDRPIESIPLASLRERVAAVTQDVQLFQASVRDNVRLFDPRVGDDRIREALAAVEMADWLAALPDGLETVLGAGGVGLSAGEAQLVAMARVFLRDPGLVLLDEASSRLDPVTARRVERATARLVRGRTAVVIAHRLATLEHVDEILVLEEGRVVEHGERAELLADPASRLRRLVETAPRERAGSPA